MIKNVKDVFKNEELRKGLLSSCNGTIDPKIFDDIEANKSVNFEGTIKVDSEDCLLESRLYKKEILLSENRISKNGDIIGSYLQAIETDGNIINNNKDVWGTTDWNLVNDIKENEPPVICFKDRDSIFNYMNGKEDENIIKGSSLRECMFKNEIKFISDNDTSLNISDDDIDRIADTLDDDDYISELISNAIYDEIK